jgi:hypothetical protein
MKQEEQHQTISLTNIPDDLEASSVPSGRNEPTVRSAVVVDVGSWTQPELSAVLPARIHDREVIDSWFEDLSFLIFSQGRNDSDEGLDLLVLEPLTSRSQFSSYVSFGRVSVTSLDTKSRLGIKHFQESKDVLSQEKDLSLSRTDFTSDVFVVDNRLLEQLEQRIKGFFVI